MKPILFNTEMVRAILDGRKTVTRRVVKPQPVCYGPNLAFDAHSGDFFLSAEKGWLRCRICGHDPEYSREGVMITHHWEPRYKVGDILYVRETFYESPAFGTMYRADWRDDACPYMEPDDKWRPSIHMPKEAARLFLRVTGVRVERLQDMKDEDAYNEGWRGPWCAHKVFENYPDSPIPCYASDGSECPPDPPCNHSIPELFGMDIWDNTIKKADLPRYGWATNPWVWVIAFERISKEEAQKGGEE